MKKSTNETFEFNKEEILNIYKQILAGKIRKFPNGMWSKETPRDVLIQRFRICTNYLMSYYMYKGELANFSILNERDFWNVSHLKHVMKFLFDSNMADAIREIYPDESLWKLAKLRREYFQDADDFLDGVKWLLTVKLGYTRKTIRGIDPTKLFDDYGWRFVPKWYLECVEGDIYKYDYRLACMDMIMEALPEYGLNDGDFAPDGAKLVSNLRPNRKPTSILTFG